MTKKSLTIIGTGLAGYNLAKEVRKLNQDKPITMITADGGESYSKPMLSNALSKGKSTQQLVLGSADKMANQLAATIVTTTSISAINPSQRCLQTSSGEIFYDSLVLAIGAKQRKVPVRGNAVNAILMVNDLEDYAKFQDKLGGADHVVIIGAGLIGCEFANDLVSTGKKVTIIGSSNTPLDRLLLPEIGDLLKEALQKKGVDWRLGVRVEDVSLTESDENQYVLSMSDGSTVHGNLVMSATGLAPNIDIAEEAGIVVNKGIVVDEYLATSIDGIHALGDCIEIDNMVLPFVLPIMHGARALAKTLTGDRTRVSYPAMPIIIKTPDYPVVVSPPAKDAVGEWMLEIDAEGAKALFVTSDERLLGFILTDKKINEKQKLAKLLPPVFV